MTLLGTCRRNRAEESAISPVPAAPVRVAVVNDYELVVAGVSALLAPFPERVRVVELDSGLPVLAQADVVLFDTFGHPQGEHLHLPTVLGEGPGRILVYSWNLHSDVIDPSLAAGAAGYVSKGASPERLVQAIESAAQGARVVPDEDGVATQQGGDWPGRVEGLSVRESEVVALITQGLSNQEIAEKCYLSINSVKTYIRTAYRKMGVTTRSQAVLWGVRHGFRPDVARHELDRERQV